ncbi:UNVERIFIED_ORG: putative tail protein [Providencia alcalifaciens]
MGKTVTNIVSAGLMVAGVIATGGLGTALIVAGIAVQAAGTFIFQDKIPSMQYRDQSERKQMLRSPTAPETIIVGKTVCSGLLFFAEEEKGDQTENERLFMALAIAAHKVDHIGQIWLNDDLIGTFGDKASYEFHNGRTDCDPYLLKNAPSWKSDMIGDGLAWLRLTLKYDAEKFPYGVPNIKVEVWGKPVYDPRTNKTAWSNNGALIILDFYRSYLGVPDSDIDFDAFKVAADLCSEPVTTPEGNTEPRYTINGAYELSESPSAILDHMHKCIAAEPTYVAGKHGILMQAYNGPAVLRIEPNQIIDTVNITPELSLRDATNAIYGTFVDAEQQYIKTDFEPVIVDEWIEEDGLEIKENMDYRFVTSPYQAARLSNLYLRKKRAGRRVQLRMNMDGYAYRPGEVILLNLPQIGIQNLEFRVAEWKFHPQEGVDILLEEDGAYIYEDIIGKPFVRPPFTVLPTGGVAPPLNLAFVATNIGEVVQGYLNWQSAAADVRYNTVNIIENGKVIQSIQVPQDRVDLSGLVRGSYRAEVRSINAAGAMSAPAIVDFDIQAPPKPVSVEMVGGMFSLTCIPHGGETAQHGYTFEFWFSDKKLASTNDTEVTTKANRQGQGQFWTRENLKPDTNYWFYVRTVNSYGKSPFVEAVGKASGTPQDMLEELGNNFLSTEAGQQMQEQIDFNKDNLTDLKIDSDDFRQKVISIDRELEAVNEAVMTVTQMSTENYWELKEESAKGKASIKQLQQVQADFTASQAKYQQEVAAQFEHTAADVLNVQNALAKSNEAFAEDIRQVRADLGETNEEVGTIKGRVTDIATATTDLEKAQAKHEASVVAEFGEMRGYLTHLGQVTTDDNKALVEAIGQTQAQFLSLHNESLVSRARIIRTEAALATETEARAEDKVQIDARFNDAEGAITTIKEVQAQQGEAIAKSEEQLRAEINLGDEALQGQLTEQGRELSEVSSVVTEHKSAIADLDKTVTQVKQTQQSQYNETKASINELSETTTSLDEAMTTEKALTESRFEETEASISSLQQTVANIEGATVEAVGQLQVQHDIQGIEVLSVKASIRRVETVIATETHALAQKVEQLDAQYGAMNSSINSLQKVVADNQKSQAEVNEFIKSEVGETQAAIEKMAKTEVDYQGNASSVISFKTAVMYNGQYYDAEMIIGAGVKNGQVVTQIGFSADTFAIFNPVSGKLETAFAVENGQVFIGSGFIQDGSITNAKIGNVIQSNDFKKGEKGWQIDKNGNPEFNDGTFRGKVYANGGEFNGTVYVEKLIGDNATATVYKEATKDEIHGNRYDQVIETSVIYVGGMPYDIDLLMPTMQFESSCSTSTGIKAAYVQVIIDGVTYTPQTTTIVGDNTSFWNLICSLYVTIPATKKDVKVTVRYTTNHENRCTTKIKPAMIIACKHNSSSFKFS